MNNLAFIVQTRIRPLRVLSFLVILLIIFRRLRLFHLAGLSLDRRTSIIDRMVSIMIPIRIPLIRISSRRNIAVALPAVFSRLSGNLNHFLHEKLEIVTLIFRPVRIFSVDCVTYNCGLKHWNQMGDEYFVRVG